MTRNVIVGALAFGLTGALSGYVWTSFEFPFAILLVAAVGWYVVVRPVYGPSAAWRAALVGGVTFTAAFLGAVFLALTDGSPVALSAWLAAALAAGVAGALTGLVLEKVRGALVVGVFSAGGMLVGTALAGALRAVAPASIDVAGPAQAAYFAAVIGAVAAITGAAIGAGVSWLRSHGSVRPGARSVGAH